MKVAEQIEQAKAEITPTTVEGYEVFGKIEVYQFSKSGLNKLLKQRAVEFGGYIAQNLVYEPKDNRDVPRWYDEWIKSKDE